LSTSAKAASAPDKNVVNKHLYLPPGGIILSIPDVHGNRCAGRLAFGLNWLLGKESITNYRWECLVAHRQSFKYRSI